MWAKKTANPLPNTTSRYETGVVFCEKRSLLFFNSATKKKSVLLILPILKSDKQLINNYSSSPNGL